MLEVIVLLAIGCIAVLFVHQMRTQRHDAIGRTKRYYAVSAPATELPAFTDICERLERQGYRIVVTSQGSVHRTDEQSMHGILTDQRYPGGRLHLAVGCRGDLLSGELESEDDGPEFYEEMARYTIHALAEFIPELGYASPGNDTKLAQTLGAELPPSPLGLL